MQNVQVCYIGIQVPWWFATPINPSSRFQALHMWGICPNALTPFAPPHKQAQVSDVPSPPCVHVFSLLNTRLWVRTCSVLIFCSCVSLLRMMVFRFIHVPTKDMNSWFYGCIVFHGVYVPHFPSPVCHQWAFGLVPVFAIVNSATVNIRVHVSL